MPRKNSAEPEDLEQMRSRLEEAEETLSAIRSGQVDAIVVYGPEGEQVYTLKGEDRLYRMLIESMSDGALTLSPDKTIFYSNKRFSSLIGAPLEKIIGSTIYDYIAPSYISSFNEALAKSVETGGGSLEAEIKRSDGFSISVNFAISVIQVEELITYCVVVTDISELKRVISDLEQFAFAASHNLQEPLRTVSNYVQLLSKRYKGKLDADADVFIEFVVNGVKHMQDLLLDLLSYSRVGYHGPSAEAVDSEAIYKKAVADLRGLIGAANAKLEHKDLPKVHMEGLLLYQVFLNLLDNALKFRAPGKQLVIKVLAEDKGNSWRFSVRDNGIGIEAQFRDKIFDLFQKLHGAKYAGTGMGLAMCKKIIERRGGRIWVESEPGKGSTFYFTLPKEAAWR